MGEWVGLGFIIGFMEAFRILDILLCALFNKMVVWD